MNNNLIEQATELLDELGIYNDFEGVDASLYISLSEYGFIHSDKYKLSIYINECGELDGLADWGSDELIESYKDAFDSWANLDEFLNFNGCKDWEEASQNLAILVLDFNLYYGIHESILSSPYNFGFKTIEEIKKWLLLSINLKPEIK